MSRTLPVLPAGLLRFGRFGVVGLASNAGLYAAFLGLIWFGMAPLGASALCYVLGVVFSYVLNRGWTFASRSSHSRDLPRFLASYGVGLSVTLASMSVLVPVLGPAAAQLLTIAITAISIYLFLHILGFGRT
jgi:putative flippase GtrA